MTTQVSDMLYEQLGAFRFTYGFNQELQTLLTNNQSINNTHANKHTGATDCLFTVGLTRQIYFFATHNNNSNINNNINKQLMTQHMSDNLNCRIVVPKQKLKRNI